jgi:hypothetical protein
MKVRIKKAPKVNKYQAITTQGQTGSAFSVDWNDPTNPFSINSGVNQNPAYIPNSLDGQRNYVNASVGLQPNAAGVGTVLQPGLMPDANNKMVNLNNVNDNLTNEQQPANQNGLSGMQKEKGQSKVGKFLRGIGPKGGMAAYENRQNWKDIITNIANYESKADLAARAVGNYHRGQPLVAATQGTFDTNSMNNITPGMLNTVPSTGDFAAAPTMPITAYGGQYMAYGGRVYNQVAPNALPDHTSEPRVAVSNTLQPIPRHLANIEAEKGETLYMLNNGGLPAHYEIGGQPHSKGGTPLNVPEDSFVFSKALKLKDKRLFPYFDITKPTSFSDIAKKYDINKFRKVLADPDTDKLQKETAEKMIANYNLKLGMLALAQESTKGFPQGLPMIAQPFTVVNAVDPEMILPTPPQEIKQRAAEQQMPEEEMVEQPMKKYGGSMKVRIKSLPTYQTELTSGNVQLPSSFQLVDGTTIDTATGQPVAPAAPAATTTNPGSTSTSDKGTTGSSGTSNFNIDVVQGNPDFWEGYNGLITSGKIKPHLAIGFTDPKERQRKSRQNKRPGTKNVFGDRDIHKGALIEDFKERQAWYFKDHPNWNYDNEDDVRDFQRAYCKRSAEFGLSGCYFNESNIKDESGRTIEGTTFDGYYGEHTFNAPGFNAADPKEEPKPEPPKEIEPEPDPEPIKPVMLTPPQEHARRTGYFPQDIINIGAAAAQRIPVPETWYAPLQFKGIDAAYLVPDYSPIMEAANISTQGVNAYGSRQSADASFALIQGKAARPAAEHNLAVANANVGIFNNAQQINAEYANKNAMYNNELAQTDFDTNALYEANRIQAQNKKRADLARLVNTAITNKATAETLSDAFSEHFYIDPTRGGHVSFYKGSPFIPNDKADMSDIEALDAQLTKLNYTAEDKKEILKAALASKYATRGNKNSYLPDYSQFMYPFNMQQTT